MMYEALVWISTLLAAQAIWLVIFHSPLVTEILDRGEGELFTSADVERWFLARSYYRLHTLWTCTTCQAVWTGVGSVLLFAPAYRLLGGQALPGFVAAISCVLLLLGTNICISKCLQKLIR